MSTRALTTTAEGGTDSAFVRSFSRHAFEPAPRSALLSARRRPSSAERRTSAPASTRHDFASISIGPMADPAEREAEEVAAKVTGSGEPPQVSVRETHSPLLRRQPSFSEDCNSFHRCNVIEPLVHARQMVDATLSELPAVASGGIDSGRIVDLEGGKRY